MPRSESLQNFIDIARTAPVVATAVRIALLVGTVLVAINHGPALLAGDISVQRILQISLTYFVPYGVSTYSSVKALQSQA